MKIKSIALIASALIGAVGTTNSFALEKSCGAGSCGKKAQKCDQAQNDSCKDEMKKEQSCGAGSCSKKAK